MPNNFSEKFVPSIDSRKLSFFERLKAEEALSPKDNEIIHVQNLSIDSEEFKYLQSAGIEKNALQKGQISRAELLRSGYIFLNKIGNGEKPILSGIVTSLDTQESIHLSNKTLLTKAELNAVIEYQRNNSEHFVLDKVHNDEVRKDMMDFFQEAMSACDGVKDRATEIFNMALKKILEDSAYTEEDKNKLKVLFTYLDNEQNSGMKLGFFIQSCLSGVGLAKARGIPVEVFQARLSALKGAPSPFLDSGYHFDINYDITLYPDDPQKTKRLNMVVVHLLSRGLNEMGSSLNNSHDQRYITAAEYVEEVLSRKNNEDVLEANLVNEEIIDLVAHRILRRIEEKEF